MVFNKLTKIDFSVLYKTRYNNEQLHRLNQPSRNNHRNDRLYQWIAL